MARARWQLQDRGSPRDGGRYSASRAAPLRPAVRARTLGAAVILIGDVRLDPSADTLFALLLRVLYSPGCSVARDTLLRSLWGGQSETRQRANLRQSLYKLRQLGVHVGLSGEDVSLDGTQVAPAFATERSAERFEEDVTRGHEPFGLFLPGYVTGNGEYDEWLATVREAVHADVRRVLVEQLRIRRGRADWMGADALARWLLTFDPLNEEATLTRAECLALNGSKAEAVALLDRFLAELGPDAGDLRLQATLLRRRISEPPGKQRVSFAPTERHFMGREELMAELTMAMRRARWHDGSATLLHGPPGMGKTRVTQELSKVAVLEGFRVVTVSCRESDQQRPLSVFLDLVPELLEMPGAMGCAPESMRVLRTLVNDASLRVLDDAAQSRANVVGNTRAPELSTLYPKPSTIRHAVIDLMASLCFESPMLFVADDAQWADKLSWQLIEEISKATATNRMFVLVGSRELQPRNRPRRQSALQACALCALSVESCIQLADALCHDMKAEAADELRSWFAIASEGTPLFLRSLVHHWVETGIAGGVPPTLAFIVEQRLRAMSEDALRVVQAATLLGRYALPATVAAILQLPTMRMLAALDELLAVSAYSASSGEHIQVHELISRAAIKQLTSHSRQLLHGRIARMLLEDRNSEDDLLVVDIVDHLKRGARREELGTFAPLAANELLRKGLPHRAIAVCEAAKGNVLPAAADDAINRAHLQALHVAGHYSQILDKVPACMIGHEFNPRWDEQHAEELLAVLDSTRHSEIHEDYAEFAARATLWDPLESTCRHASLSIL